MFYSYRGKNYKIGIAIKNNNKWKRNDKKICFKKSSDLFDNKMYEYGAVVKYKNQTFMFLVVFMIMNKHSQVMNVKYIKVKKYTIR